MSMFHLGIGIPSTHLWEADFGMHLSCMIMKLMQVRVADYKDGTRIEVINKRGSILPNLRNEIVVDALDRKCTHLLWIDSDQTFPDDTVHRLAAHHCLVVGANVATKAAPPYCAPTARKRSEKHERAGDIAYTMENSKGLEEVWRLGTGVMLMDMRIFGRIPQPWFEYRWEKENGALVGEDWVFCEKLEKLGTSIWVDHDLSKLVGHLGPLNFNHDLVLPHMLEAHREKALNAA